MIGKSGTYKAVGLLLGVLVVLSVVNTMQFAKVSATANATVHTSGASIKFLARDKGTDGNPILKRAENSSTLLTTTYILSLGTWASGQVVTYTGAFGLVNEEQFAITLNSVTVTGTISDYIHVFAHSNPLKTCLYDSAASVNVTSGAPGSTNVEAEAGFKKMWANDSQIVNTWALAAGDGDVSTYQTGGTDKVAAFNGGTNNIWYKAAGDNDACTAATDDTVWIEIALVLPNDVASASLTGSMSFEFKATAEVA